MSIKNKLLRGYFSLRERQIDRFVNHPHDVQHEQFRSLVQSSIATQIGREFGLSESMTVEQFGQSMPTFDYESFKSYITKMVEGQSDVACRGVVNMYARSSGTTSDRSKYIPITKNYITNNHVRGMSDLVTFYIRNYPNSKVFDGKTLTLGGSCQIEGNNMVGDLSAILLKHSGAWSGWFRTPSIETSVIADFEQKAQAICKECVSQNITSFAGVPSWNLELMRRVLDYTGKSNLLEVWPNLELFAHGGVAFTPYRRSFEELIPSSEMRYMENYNASEGFFAVADDPSRNDMLLMLDYGVFFEFRRGDVIVPLEGVECGGQYAVIITAANGLWRYEIGDVVEFTSVNPYRIRFAGRTRQFINAFGEELIVDNADNGLAYACEQTGAVVEEYSVAPQYMSLREQGYHEWVVEFRTPPADVERFAQVLDDKLRQINSDYDAKRHTALSRLKLHVVERGHFLKWLTRRGKNKVPRMTNDRSVVEQLLEQTTQNI